MSYEIEFSRQAAKKLKRLDKTTVKRLQDKIDKLADDPFSNRLSDDLIMVEGQRYSRVGDWRVIFEVKEAESIIYIAAIQHRSKVYEEL